MTEYGTVSLKSKKVLFFPDGKPKQSFKVTPSNMPYTWTADKPKQVHKVASAFDANYFKWHLGTIRRSP